MLLEMCVESVESAIASGQGGADRVEFCANLLEGGTTPSLGAIRETKRRTNIALSVMVRPRGGDFCATTEEFAVMREDVKIFREEGADCVVFGLLRPDGSVDVERTQELIELARPLEVTFHRAFDMTRDPFEALEALVELGVQRVLTSGQEPSAFEGAELIGELVERAADRIVVMPGGGVRPRNIERIVAVTGAKEIHVASRSAESSPMEFRNTAVFMGGALRSQEYSRFVTRSDSVRELVGKIS